MKLYKTTFLALTAVFFTLFSCDNTLTPIKVTDENLKEEIDSKVLKQIEGIDDFKIVKLELKALKALTNSVTGVDITYAKDGVFKTKLLYLDQYDRILDGKALILPSSKINERVPKKYSEFDFSKIASNVEKAMEMIKTDYPDMVFESVSTYTMKAGFTPNTQQDFFTFHVVKEGNESYRDGRQVITDYFSIDFKVSEQGEVTYKK